ncbi:uncharacterized protein [Porites lutea]|uniref:uncharacterized protein isoform X1 n=2 Tax=Porites lutea TaxID=51062 RepID=UPI003CC5C4A8
MLPSVCAGKNMFPYCTFANPVAGCCAEKGFVVFKVFEKMSAGKKQRSSRFTQGMTDALVEAYGKHQYILQSKFSNLVTNEKKKEAWIKVADAVNAVNPAERKTVEQVKKKWEDVTGSVKKKERHARQQELKKLNTTGNGFLADEDNSDSAGPSVDILSQSEQEVARILGPEIFTGIPGGQDTMKLTLPKPVSDVEWETYSVMSDSLLEDNYCGALQEVSPNQEVTLHQNSMYKRDSIPSTSTANVKSNDTDDYHKAKKSKMLAETLQDDDYHKAKKRKTLSEAQLDYFETVTAYYKLKMKKVELEISMLKDKKDKGRISSSVEE